MFCYCFVTVNLKWWEWFFVTANIFHWKNKIIKMFNFKESRAFSISFSFKWILFLLKMWKSIHWKTISLQILRKMSNSHISPVSPSSKNHLINFHGKLMGWWMAALGWNGFSKSHKNLGGLSRSHQRVNLSQWMHNLNWISIKHIIFIFTSYECSI